MHRKYWLKHLSGLNTAVTIHLESPSTKKTDLLSTRNKDASR